jgi:hypothetical protein
MDLMMGVLDDDGLSSWHKAHEPGHAEATLPAGLGRPRLFHNHWIDHL